MQRERSSATENRADAEHSAHRRRVCPSAVPIIGEDSEAAAAVDESTQLFERFSLDETCKLGEGAYGVTYAATETASSRPAAVKVINTRMMRSPNAVERCRTECTILSSLDHPNVIKVLGHGTGPSTSSHLYFIFMERASGGELLDQIVSANLLVEVVAKRFMRQLLAGVEHLHAQGVAHRDLKLENALLTEVGGSKVKIIDFGLSHVYPKTATGAVDRSTPLVDMCGSPSYCAPEVRMGVGYDGFQADVWSLGVCFFAMLSGFFPLEESSDKDPRFAALLTAQRQGHTTTHTVYGWYGQSYAHLSPAAVELVDGMLTMNPAQRLGLPDVLRHRWLDDVVVPNAPVDEEEPVYRSCAFSSGSAEWAGVDEESYCEPHVYRGLGDILGDVPAVAPPPALRKQAAFGDTQSLWVY
jgi:serine/threonine protein kinase